MAEQKIPILAVCGDSDKVVPFAENMKLLRDAYVKLGRTVELIIKPGADHHPHSLEKPEPIVNFIIRHQPAYQKKQHYNVRGSLANSFIRFEKERKGRVAFFGGSITEMRGWRNMIQDQLKQRFPFTEFDFVDAGIPSTGTTPHAFRMENDVLSRGDIDLLFIEGAVNDHTNGFSPRDQIRGMEGVVRHALTANPYTDIIMLHFVYEPFLQMFPKGQTPDVILNHERVANHYLIPSINCARKVSERIEDKEFTWKEFGGVHPKWFTYSFKGKAVGLFMACGPYSGIIEYSIDGKEFRKLDTFTKWSKRLYLPWLYVLDSELDSQKTRLKNKQTSAICNKIIISFCK